MDTEVKNILKKNGLRQTSIRSKVLEVLLHSDQALSHHKIEEAFDYVDRITLYRTLKTFKEKGIIHEAKDGTDTAKFAMCSNTCSEHAHHDHHAHFYCTTCEKTICLEEIESMQIDPPKGFNVEKTDVIMQGMCIECNSL